MSFLQFNNHYDTLYDKTSLQFEFICKGRKMLPTILQTLSYLVG